MDCKSDSQLSDMLVPYLHPIQFPAYGKFGEFPAVATTPQQDHYPDGRGVKIPEPTDKRAQPLRYAVMANCHSTSVENMILPTEAAGVKEVKEFIYLITKIDPSLVAFKHPEAVCATLQAWKRNGFQLRNMLYLGPKAFDKLCPAAYISVYHELVYISKEVRTLIGRQIVEYLIPLLTDDENSRDDDSILQLKKAARKEYERIVSLSGIVMLLLITLDRDVDFASVLRACSVA